MITLYQDVSASLAMTATHKRLRLIS